MRLVLAILAMLALVSSPTTAAAAQLACSQSVTIATAVMGMPETVNHGVTAKSPRDPCCDPGAQHQHKMNSKDCAKACASSYVTIAALPDSPVGFLRAYARASVSPARGAAVLSYRPSGPERPPKSMG